MEVKHEFIIESFFENIHNFSQHTIDEVENLIKKHEAFEKSAAAQEERFSALHRLTTVSSSRKYVNNISIEKLEYFLLCYILFKRVNFLH